MARQRGGDREKSEKRQIRVEQTVDVHTIDVPVSVPAEGGYQATFTPQHQIHVTSVTERENWGLHILFGGLRRTNATMPNGKPVVTKNDAIRYLLHACANGVELSLPSDNGA